MTTTSNPPNGRGCGIRSPGGTYLCCSTGINGKPVEYFVLDPVKLWVGDFQRGFKILPTKYGYNNVAIFVGESFYKSCWDFVEEVRHFGASRKVTPTFPFEKLTPGKSRMIFIHASCYIPENLYHWFETDEQPPLDKHCSFNGAVWDKEYSGWHPKVEKNTFCTFAHRNLAYWFHWPDLIREGSQFVVNLPSCQYVGQIPDVTEEIYANPELLKEYLLPGAFLSLPLTHVEFPKIENRNAKLRANKAGFETVVMEY